MTQATSRGKVGDLDVRQPQGAIAVVFDHAAVDIGRAMSFGARARLP